MVEAWETQGGFRPSASWQAVTCLNTETAPKYTMRRQPAFTCGLSTSSILDFRPILFLEAIQASIYSDSAPQVQRNASKAPAQISVAQNTF